MASSKIRVGMSGWTHAPWKEKFYPKGLSAKKQLEYASRQVNSIEINGTFYSMQKPESFINWHDQTPEDFQFAIKGGQYITHIRRLKDIDDALANFFASGILCLKQKLGPILWQFPPNFTYKDDRVEAFLEKLPKTSYEAERLAAQHTAKLQGRAWIEAGGEYPIRHAFEMRHSSFDEPRFYELLRKHGASWVLAHAGKKGAPYTEELTGDFVYLRLHGEGTAYRKGYPEKDLGEWAKKVRGWSKTKSVFLYFDNAEKVTAPLNAVALCKKLKLVSKSKNKTKIAKGA